MEGEAPEGIRGSLEGQVKVRGGCSSADKVELIMQM